MPDFARLYATFRGSKAFLSGLVTFVAMWMGIHFLTGFDSDWGMLNLFLSLEASISLAFFTMLSDKQDAHSNEQAADVRRIAESILTIAETQRDMLADHAALLHTLRDGDEQILKTLTETEVRDGMA